MIDKTVKSLLEEGFKPWGCVIPDPKDAPKGSQLQASGLNHCRGSKSRSITGSK